jgi:hypothetical protein
MVVFSDNQYFIVRKFHPSEVIDIEIKFSLAVLDDVGVVFEVEFFLVEQQTVDFDLGFVFPHKFQEDTPVAV